MSVPRIAVISLFAYLTAFSAGVVSAQNFPNKPIRFVTSGTGGSSDFVSRLIAQSLSGRLGQQIIVDNRTAGVIPGTIVARAQPDGYTLLVTGSSHWLAQYLQDDAPYDAARDFSPITLAANSPNILAVYPSVANSVKDLIALAKARPGELNYAEAGRGGSPHLAAELFNSMAGVNIVRVPYNGAGLALNDLIAGRVQIMFAVAAAAMPHIKSGRLRGLAVTTSHPSALAPGLQTVAASGLPGYESVGMFGLFAPAKTPVPIITRLNYEIVQVLNTTELKEKCLNVGVETVGSTPEEFGAAVRSEMSRMGKIIKNAGIRSD